eukprot:10064663-Prorocentrum_lima.AAC.1
MVPPSGMCLCVVRPRLQRCGWCVLRGARCQAVLSWAWVGPAQRAQSVSPLKCRTGACSTQ